MTKLNKIAIASLLTIVSTVSFAQNGVMDMSEDNMKAATAVKPQPVMSLNQVLSGNVKNKSSDNVPNIRRDALIDIASAYGTSAGLAAELNRLKNEWIKGREGYLDSLFDFSKIALESGVLAPVITVSEENFAQNSTDEIRFNDKHIIVEEHARFVPVYPTWRDYLNFVVPEYELPPKSFLPKDAEENAIWDEWVKKGWDNGVTQANIMLDTAFNRLDRDYDGMINFHLLAKEKIASRPIIEKHNMGVTGGGREISVNDQILRITDHTSLNPNKEQWKTTYPITWQQNGVTK